MREQLGVRCPDCGTGDVPVVLQSGTTRSNEQYVLLGCVKCGRVAAGNAWENATGLIYRDALPLALRAFYGPQEAVAVSPATINADLLAALEGFIDWDEKPIPTVSLAERLAAARAVIAKVKGGER